jgi:type III secretion protein V
MGRGLWVFRASPNWSLNLFIKEHYMKTHKFDYGSDIAMVLLVVAILSLMVFPLPTLIIDALIGVNMTISVVLLMVTMYIPNAVALTSFPSLLLFTTLLRLSLNIASTKLILLHADAGHIIEAFGNLVVGGNIVVGIVVFLIISVVQFIVIAKGSERVAEVGARFTLDAMPGKQMSIDADMRSGHLSADDARRKRSALGMESQLHGGMDGAMKFVKGDAIASLIITFINIFAGIVIGVTYHGMTAGDAANRFTILSIGDAMVSQIPSLLISVAAGVLITRVNDEHALKPKSLGEEIFSQLAGSPRALYLASGLLVGFAAVPGFPWFVFLALAVGLVLMGRFLSKKPGLAGTGKPDFNALKREGDKSDSRGIEKQATAFSCPVAVTLSSALGAGLNPETLNTAFEKERIELQGRLGLPFPGIRIWTTDRHAESVYEILVHDVPNGRGEVRLDKAMLLEPSDDQISQCEQVISTNNEANTYWIKKSTDLKIGVLQSEEVIAKHVVRVLQAQAHQFVGIQEVQWLFERMAKDYPGLVAEVMKVVPLQRTADVLKRLLEEQISIRNMRTICESLIVWGPKEKDIVMLTEYVRGDLGRYLTHRATSGSSSLSVVLLDQQVEKIIRDSIKPTPAGNYLAMAPDSMAEIAQRIFDIVGEAPRAGLAVVTSMDIRRYVRRIIEARMSWLNVYSFQELNGHVALEPIGRVSL